VVWGAQTQDTRRQWICVEVEAHWAKGATAKEERTAMVVLCRKEHQEAECWPTCVSALSRGGQARASAPTIGCRPNEMRAGCYTDHSLPRLCIQTFMHLHPITRQLLADVTARAVRNRLCCDVPVLLYLYLYCYCCYCCCAAYTCATRYYTCATRLARQSPSAGANNCSHAARLQRRLHLHLALHTLRPPASPFAH
jgi:hypothetical protein